MNENKITQNSAENKSADFSDFSLQSEKPSGKSDDGNLSEKAKYEKSNETISNNLNNAFGNCVNEDNGDTAKKTDAEIIAESAESIKKDEKDNESDCLDTENFDIRKIDRDKLNSALLADSDDEIYRLLKNSGLSKSEIVEIKNDYVNRAKSALFYEDLAEIVNEYGIKYEAITDMPNFRKFAILRSGGLSATEAFLGANPKVLNAKSDNGNLDQFKLKKITHGHRAYIEIPENELKLWQSAFPKESVESLTKRYNRALNG